MSAFTSPLDVIVNAATAKSRNRRVPASVINIHQHTTTVQKAPETPVLVTATVSSTGAASVLNFNYSDDTNQSLVIKDLEPRVSALETSLSAISDTVSQHKDTLDRLANAQVNAANAFLTKFNQVSSNIVDVDNRLANVEKLV